MGLGRILRFCTNVKYPLRPFPPVSSGAVNDRFVSYLPKGYVDLAPGEPLAAVGSCTVKLAHDLGFEFHVLCQCHLLIVGVIEQERESELSRPAASVSPLEARQTVSRQLETLLRRELFRSGSSGARGCSCECES